MSWDELETRLRQEVSKRLDVALCQIGLQPGKNGLRLAAGSGGRFFFSPDDLPSRVNLLREHLPQQAAQIVAEAGNILHHRFRLLGYSEVSYGPEIDWHLDAVHGLRAPLIPWFKINFLNFHEVGDHKITWELNRHQHMVTLAKAWLLTGEKVYADEIFAQWYSWQRANPYPMGANWASSLEVAFRSLSWIWVDHLLAESLHKPATFRDDLVHALALNGRHIERYLSTYFSPNTHLLGEAVVLFFIGALYSQIPSSSKWKTQSWKIIQEEAIRQVRPDGIYFEQTLYYHVYALDFMIYARLLASRNGIEVPLGFDQVLRKMLAFVQAVSQVGPPDGFGDDDGGRVFDGARNRSEHMTDPLALGAALFHDQSLASTLTEEAIWLFGESTLAWQSPRAPSHLYSQAFPDGGVYVVAGSDPLPQQMVIDAGPQGIGHCGHGHADALSVKLSFAGRRWLVDAGTGCYIGPGNKRNTFRGTLAHNTLAVDGIDQAQPDGPFAWTSIPKTQVDLYIRGQTFALFSGLHSGYERLGYAVRHRRFVLQIGSFWLIRDVADGSGLHSLQISWHFAPEVDVIRQGNGFMAAPIQGETCLLLLPVEDVRWKSDLLSEEVSPAYGEIIAAPVVRCTAQVETPAEHAVLLVAALNSSGANDVGTLARINLERIATAPTIYRYTQGTVAHHMIFRPAQKGAWSFGPWICDAAFLYFCLQDRRITQLLFCEGSFVKLRGDSLISHGGPLQWLEWTNRDGGDHLACSDKAAASTFSASGLESEITI
jgi:hypothetical protein